VVWRAIAVSLTLVWAAGCAGRESGAGDDPAPSAVHGASPVQDAVTEGDRPGRTRIPAKDADDTATAVGEKMAVTSAEANASRIGLDILRAGGNAVDAAVAVGFALSVTHPSAGNIGGGGFMIIVLPDGTAEAIDFREVAPGKATRDMYLDKKGAPTDASRIGARAAGIPGNVAGFGLAHEKYGRLPWRDVVAPAVALARDGHVVDRFHAEDLQGAVERMGKRGQQASVVYFSKPDGTPYADGDRWVQPELAATLQAIAEGGPRAFYEGALAKSMVTEVRKAGGIWSEKDLAGYRALVREPIRFEYRGHEIITMPPPSAGGVVLRQVLAGAEALSLHELEWDDPQRIHLYVELLRRTYADRNLLLGDPGFVEIPMAQLLDPAYAVARAKTIDAARATPSSEIGAGTPAPARESLQTTHFSVLDADGVAVSNTFTLNGGFGSGVVLPSTGVLLNNEMDDFTAKPGSPNMFGLVQGPQNAIAPGKRMLSSMTPTVVRKDGKLRAIVGSPGGPTISTTVAQIVLQLVDHGRTVTQAVQAPRVHHQWLPDRILTENALPSASVDALEAKGHEVVQWDRIGHANCIEIDPITGGVRAVADVSRDGGLAVAE
jgi:gamma-glutamyltranspeptidase/glutathione hydrolase